MWFAIAMGAILFAQTELDELADARIFSMHMLQHLMQNVPDPAADPAGDAGLDAEAVDAQPADQARRAHAHDAGSCVPDFFQQCRDRALSADLRSYVPRRELSHLSALAVHGGWNPAVVADPESAPGAAALSYPAQILYLFLLMISDDCGRRTDSRSRRASSLSVVQRRARTDGPETARRQVLGGLIMWIGQGTYLMFIFTFIFLPMAQQRDDSDIPVVAGSRRHRASRAAAAEASHASKSMLWLVASRSLVTMIHAAYVAFVVVGFVAILIGWAARWDWVRNRYFRIVQRRDDPVGVLRGARRRNLSAHHLGEFVASKRRRNPATRAILVGYWLDSLMLLSGSAVDIHDRLSDLGALVILTFWLVPLQWPGANRSAASNFTRRNSVS